MFLGILTNFSVSEILTTLNEFSIPKLGMKWFILVRVSNKTQLLLALKV